MRVPVLQAAKHLCKKSKWEYSNLELQKILYIAHMFHLGAEGSPLVNGNFEAWEYGPVHPDLYQVLKIFGARPVSKSFPVFELIEDIEQGSEMLWLDDAAKVFPPGNGPHLVAITHREHSAWSRHYRPGVKGIVIPNESIIEEYQYF